jgi:hypothetical protein
MRKELTVYVATNEPDEEVKVMRVKDDPQFFMLSLGGSRIVVNIGELMEAVGAISHFSALFEQEEKMRAMRDAKPAAPVIPTVVASAPKKFGPKKKSDKANEDEDAVVFEAQVRTGPTASELELEKQMGQMQGESLVFREK